MPRMSDADRDEFLAKLRVGTLTYLGRSGAPVAIPIWFDWDGGAIRMVTGDPSPKLKYLKRDPRVSLVVSNHPDELEGWVAFDGEVRIVDEGGLELIEKMATRYWTVMDDRKRALLENFRKHAALLRVLELTPTEIRTSNFE